MKRQTGQGTGRRNRSHSARSAWIETHIFIMSRSSRASHSARSAWIETGRVHKLEVVGKGRTPQGVRGLKRYPSRQYFTRARSHSARSAWIETAIRGRQAGCLYCRTPQGVRGLKHHVLPVSRRPAQSHSARSAWIETKIVRPDL